jgi:hypothetical protein
MDAEYHIQICRHAVGDKFTAEHLSVITNANIRQDGMFTGLLGHPEYHYDGGNLSYGENYLISQKKLVFDYLSDLSDATKALRAMGRYFHCLQDFYAHSNYVELWINSFGSSPIEPKNPAIMKNGDLFVCRTYYPLEAITYFRTFRPFASKRLPDDSHVNMNLDDPSRGELFPIAMDAAIKRTKSEFLNIKEQLTQAQIKLFTGK